MKSPAPAQARIYEAAVRLFADRGTTHASVTELAQAAGLARGTIYNNVENPDSLFDEVAAALGDEMHARILQSFRATDDPALRLTRGMRFFVRRAHEEPHWGRFIVRFAFTASTMRSLLAGPPARDLRDGVAAGRYRIRPEQAPSVLAFVGSTTLAAMWLVLNGEKTWREAGSDAAELTLCAIGVAPEEARALASTDLPPLPEPADASLVDDA
ncbi:TetR family transcriptional regulator [Roseiarcus fermentans]|uniref:TetR family transcriptional regulator n=1 Tax=Roseiarcus fermentans TaxID=1473586 RepID=A0A366FWG7_9HYPH|nr:TetR/AcrR family transcriptional regulator [Roseiarcus fermentans]RBP18370.1 TetR family transcriptional regulator [Roseiarcus fermentans]